MCFAPRRSQPHWIQIRLIAMRGYFDSRRVYVSTESLAVTTLLTKRHANIGCERYPPIRALSNRDTQWGGRDNEHITAQMRRPSRQRTWSTTSQNSKTHKVEKSCPARANETAFMRRAHEPKIAPSPGAHPGYAVGRHTRIKLDVPCENSRVLDPRTVSAAADHAQPALGHSAGALAAETPICRAPVWCGHRFGRACG